MSKTVTIQIGNSDDRLTQKEWSHYVEEVKRVVDDYALETHFFGGSAIDAPWQNAAWVIVSYSDDTATTLAYKLRFVREKFGQDSIAWTEGETRFI